MVDGLFLEGWWCQVSLSKGSMVASRCFGQTPRIPPHSFIIGGWWTRPSNWKANTAIVFAGILGVSYGVWTVSADKEVSTLPVASISVDETLDFQYRYNEPTRPIPSMRVRLCFSVFYITSLNLSVFSVGKAVPGLPRKAEG
jgi:hypothetical protein